MQTTEAKNEYDPYLDVPKSVRIGNMEWIVEVSDINDSTAQREFGHTNIMNQKIRLRPDQTPQCLANTFLHECIHAIHWVYGLWDGDPTEEQFTNQTANGLCTFFQDNPKATQWILKNNSLKNDLSR